MNPAVFLSLPDLRCSLLLLARGPRGLRNHSQGSGPAKRKIRLRGVKREWSQLRPPGVGFSFVDGEDLFGAPES
ncbi:hypothetical protein H671_2g6786 [Cricetulus griseus]|nr:hypothetical protein H671_2g6786 [Cricetulus griseus]